MSRTLAELARLDNPASATPLYIWWANQVGHFFLGMVACVAVGPWFAVLPYIAKEAALDLRAGRLIRHWRDSITDVAFWALGAGAGAQVVVITPWPFWALTAALAAGLAIGAERGWDGGQSA